MILPASDKFLAIPVVAQEDLTQGQILKLSNYDGTRMKAAKIDATGDVAMGTFLAYYISPDSEDVEYTGKPESTDFTLNTDTGVGGGTNSIPSGTEFVALGGSKVALVRVDKNALYNTPSSLTSYTPGTILKAESTSGRLALDADDDIDVTCAMVTENDGSSIVVLLA